MTDGDSSVARLKTRLRTEAKAGRARVSDRAERAEALMAAFEASPWAEVLPGTVVAGYWPVRSEIDPRPLLDHLRCAGAVIALPAVEVPQAPLVFRLWDGGIPVHRDLANMAAPPPHARKLVPALVLTPLLLVDRLGHRLGYGGGYYDRTLDALRRRGEVTALGLAFETQLTDELPRGVDDAALDGLLTEGGWRAFGGKAAAAPHSGPQRPA